MYKIYPLYLGRFKNFEKSLFTYRKSPGKMIESPLLAYLVIGNNEKILVDTGPAGPDITANLTHREIHDPISITDALKKHDLMPEDINRIVLTHLHWDHAYNLEVFPGIEILVQKKELEYAVNPLPTDMIPYGYNEQNGPPCWINGFHRMIRIEGDKVIGKGLELVFLPGHTPGSQSLQVETEEGIYFITSDIFPLYENYENAIPSGIHVDLRDWYNSLEKTRKKCDFILPGHDVKVLEKNVYGIKD